ncbi:MAG TPA: HGGxSTG domain-containing protein [Pseudaminobacter sp.]|nr:HGGxSTG domain-containing protein [Pseudaminobacter sp.]
MADEPHAPGNPRWRELLELANAATRCGAKRRDGGSCLAPAMPNGRCRMHGGMSTGPTTPEGLERSRKANWKHGYYSAKAKQERLQARIEVAALLKLIKQFSRSEG